MTKTVTTREFLRNFKTLREELDRGEVDELHVAQKAGKVMVITLQREETPAQRMMRFARENPLKNMQRPELDLFDERT